MGNSWVLQLSQSYMRRPAQRKKSSWYLPFVPTTGQQAPLLSSFIHSTNTKSLVQTRACVLVSWGLPDKVPQTGGSKQQKIDLPSSGGQKSEIEVWAELAPTEARGENPSHASLLASGGCWRSLVFRDVELHPSDLSLHPQWPSSPRLCLKSPSPFSDKDLEPKSSMISS